MFRLKLAYVSATGTTRKVLHAVAEGMGLPFEEWDFTPPDSRRQERTAGPEDFVLFGAPVYAGRVPSFVTEYLQRYVSGRETRCAVVGVYGNREYEDFLLELADTVQEKGFLPVAGAAFIGEHSLTDQIAPGRPDEQDLDMARRFGRELRERLDAGAGPLAEGVLPGRRPYRERGGGKPMSPETDASCRRCGLCAARCPMGAIDPKDPFRVNEDACIHCLCCVRICPVHAKAFCSEAYQQMVASCIARFQYPRKEPEWFLG